MISHYRRLDCFIIKRINYKEADRIITVFSKQKGKLTLIAKGIRKITSKRAPSLELFNRVNLLAYKTGGLDIITEVKLSDSYSSFANDYQKTYIAYQIVELIDKLTGEKEEQLQLYNLLKTAFNYLKKQDKIDKDKSEKIIVRFKKRILDILGFGVPSDDSIENLTRYIENIIEKELQTRKQMKI